MGQPPAENLYNRKICHVSHRYVDCLYSGKKSRQHADRLHCCTPLLNVLSTVIFISLLIYRKGFLVGRRTAKIFLMSLTNLLIFTKRFFLISMLMCGIAALPQLLKISAESATGHAQVPLVNVPKKHLNGQHHTKISAIWQ